MAENPSTMTTSAPAALGQPKVFRHGKKSYAIGLFWQVANSATTAAREAKDLSAEKGMEADLFVLRKIDENGQFGLARKADGVPVRAISAAAVLADFKKGSWLGVFSLADGWWFVSVRDDLLLPDGDRFFVSEHEARDRFNEAISEGAWDTIYAPEGWAPNVEQLPIDELLIPAAGPRLNETNPIKARLKSIIIIGMTLLIAAVSAYMYGSWQQERERQIVEEQVKNKLDNIRNNQADKPTPPWFLAPVPAAVMDNCLAAMQVIPPGAPGWDLQRISCDKKSATYRWDRKDGTVSWFSTWIKKYGNFDQTFEPSGKDVRVKITIPTPNARGEEPIYKTAEVMKYLMMLAQSTDTPLRIGSPRIEQKPADAPKTWTPAEYAPLPFQIDTESVDLWKDHLIKISGLVINKIEWHSEKQTYQITGDVYVRVR